MILNQERDAIPSRLSLRQFASALQSLDLSAIPPEKRALAIREHLAKIIVASSRDFARAQELQDAWRGFTRHIEASRNG